MVKRMRAGFKTNFTKDAQWRIQQLKAVRRALQNHEEEALDAMAKDLGRGRAEAAGELATCLVRCVCVSACRWVGAHVQRLGAFFVPSGISSGVVARGSQSAMRGGGLRVPSSQHGAIIAPPCPCATTPRVLRAFIPGNSATRASYLSLGLPARPFPLPLTLRCAWAPGRLRSTRSWRTYARG